MTEKPEMKRYIVTWIEEREVVAFATSENEALLNTMGVNGRWTKRYQYKIKEI